MPLGELDEICARLEAIAEELADMAMVRLRESIDSGDSRSSSSERVLTRARRSVEKAAAVLRERPDPDTAP